VNVRVRPPAAFRNLLSLTGGALATAAAALFAILFVLDALGYLKSPYLGLLVFVGLPAVLVLGLLLIPLGAWREARLRQRFPDRPTPDWPVIDLRQGRQRTVLASVLLLTLVNLVIVSVGAYTGVHYMESNEFCGLVCHTTMEPQFVAYQDAPHSRVPCVACHVGSGAQAAVEAKLSGTRQLWGVVTNRVPRPLPSPVRSMRPARDTCEQCHWPEKRFGDVRRVFREFADDDRNSAIETTMLMHVGGGSAAEGTGSGIHWHMNLGNEVEYVAIDQARQVIPYVRLTTRAGVVKEYVAEGTKPEDIARGERRRMDCIDCHNRAAHRFAATPERAIDRAIAEGRIPAELPFVRREAVAAVALDYPTRDAALEDIAEQLRGFYATQGRAIDPSLVDRAVSGAQTAYRRNVFPTMKVTWGTYPSQSGHIDSPGCFRCHDDNHKAQDGSVIRQDCELCHTTPQ
jgi:nitrate/TMAO reductase-like tetraheme cytochrome c subunit